jgi:hypothetical protein
MYIDTIIIWSAAVVVYLLSLSRVCKRYYYNKIGLNILIAIITIKGGLSGPIPLRVRRFQRSRIIIGIVLDLFIFYRLT